MSAYTCLMCNHSNRLFYDVFKTSSKHSQTLVSEFIEKFTKYNLDSFTNEKVCNKCYEKINKYDESEMICHRIEEYFHRLFNENLKYNNDIKIEVCDSVDGECNQGNFVCEVGLSVKCVTEEDVVKAENEVFYDPLESEEELEIYPDVFISEEGSQSNGVEATSVSESAFECPSCNKRYKQKSSLSEHQEFECGKEPQFCCEVCSKMFHLRTGLRKHMVTHKDTKYNCSKCSKSYSQRSKLSAHVQFRCGKEPQFQCEICARSFHLKIYLLRHMASHNDPTFECPSCGKRFKRKSCLAAHLKSECGEPQFRCEVCAKTFAFGSKLRMHMAVHNDTTYDCPKCLKRYSHRSSLSKHVKYECDKPPQFVCEHCSKTFHLETNLTKHIELHNNSSIECPKCPKVFTRKSSFLRHRKFECGQEPQFRCQFCSRAFQLKANLKQHLNRGICTRAKGSSPRGKGRSRRGRQAQKTD